MKKDKYLKLSGKPPQGQTMIIQKDTRLICRLETCKHQMWNSQLLTVVDFCQKQVQLKCDDTGRLYTVPHNFIAEKTHLG